MIRRLVTFALLVPAAFAGAAESPVGDWAFDVQGAHWLRVSESDDGTFAAQVMWSGSPEALTDVRVSGGLFYGKRVLDRNETVQYVPGVRETFGVLCADGLHLTVADFDLQGRSLTNTLQAVAHRIPQVGPPPNLAKISYGEPIDLLKDGLKDWVGRVNGNPFLWRFADGVLANESGPSRRRGQNLVSRRSDFGDFELSASFKIDPRGNSGIYLRGRYEIQLMDSLTRPLDVHCTGALYGRIVPSSHAEKAAGEWQELAVTLCARHLTVVLNGRTVIDNRPVDGVTGGAIDSDDFESGPIVLQGDHSGVAFRKLVVRPIVGKGETK